MSTGKPFVAGDRVRMKDNTHPVYGDTDATIQWVTWAKDTKEHILIVKFDRFPQSMVEASERGFVRVGANL